MNRAVRPTSWRHLGLWFAGSAGLVLVAWASALLGFSFATASFLSLALIILLSLLDSLVSSVMFSGVAALSLNFFLVEPRGALHVAKLQDLTALATFLLASLAITSLVRRVRQLSQERLSAEQRLRELDRSYLSEAQKLSLTGSFGWTVGSGEVFWSDESYRIFGYDDAERPTLEAMLARVHPEDNHTVRATLEAAARDLAPMDLEARLAMPDGSVKSVHVVAHPLETDGRQFVGAIRDVTAQRAAQAALSYSEYRYQNLFRALAASFWEVDFNASYQIVRGLRHAGVKDVARHLADNPQVVRELMRASRVIDVNDQTVALFGRGDKAELMGSVEPFWPEESTHIYAASMIAAISGQPHFMAECRLQTIEGRLFEAHFTACFPRESVADGRLLIGVIDISERVQAQERLRVVQAEFAHAARVSMLGELTASIAHEVNQPLAAINTNASASLRWLDRAEPDLTEVRLLATRIIADSARASEIVSRVRAMATRHAPERAAQDINNVIAGAMDFLRHEVQAHGAALALELADGLPPVLIDRTELQQVIVNLVVNALQAMAHSPTRSLAVRTILEDGVIVVTIDDTGPGMPDDAAERVFESFYTTKEAGMGMGLPICRSILENHGGSITIANRAEGGARATVALPVSTV